MVRVRFEDVMLLALKIEEGATKAKNKGRKIRGKRLCPRTRRRNAALSIP